MRPPPLLPCRDFLAPEAVEPYKDHLLRWCARYLLEAKGANGRAHDRVEHFHLSNGARMGRVNWMANPSDFGMERSFGMMVNYRYDLRYIAANHEAHVATGEVAHSAAVPDLL